MSNFHSIDEHTFDAQVHELLRNSLSKVDADTFMRLGLSPYTLWSEYQSVYDGKNHQTAVRHVFTQAGTCKENQGVIRKVLSAAKKAQQGASAAASRKA